MAEQEIPTPDVRFHPDRNNENAGEIGHGPGSLPYDLPVIMRVLRHYGPVGDAEHGLLGWELDLAVLNRGRVQIKMMHLGGMAVLVDGKIVAKTEPQRPTERAKPVKKS